MSKESWEVQELELWIMNDEPLYNHMTLVCKNLIRKHAAGIYNRNKAVKAFQYTVTMAAKKYHKSFNEKGHWYTFFPKQDRERVAKNIRDNFEEEARLGTYDKYIPKKYQGKVTGKTICHL